MLRIVFEPWFVNVKTHGDLLWKYTIDRVSKWDARIGLREAGARQGREYDPLATHLCF